MAQSGMYSINENFKMEALVSELCDTYRARGYTVTAFPIGRGACIDIVRGEGGISVVTGLVEGLKVELTPNPDYTVLSVSFSNERWADKVIALVLGMFCCFITYITCAIGAYRQFKLSGEILTAVQMSISRQCNGSSF